MLTKNAELISFFVGCETLDIFTFTACSHYRAPLYFAESILLHDAFKAHQCDLSLIQLPAHHRNCLNGSSVVLMVKMGEHIDRKYVYRFNFTLREAFLTIFISKNLISLGAFTKQFYFPKNSREKHFFSYFNSARGVFYVETFNNFPYGQG